MNTQCARTPPNYSMYKCMYIHNTHLPLYSVTADGHWWVNELLHWRWKQSDGKQWDGEYKAGTRRPHYWVYTQCSPTPDLRPAKLALVCWLCEDMCVVELYGPHHLLDTTLGTAHNHQSTHQTRSQVPSPATSPRKVRSLKVTILYTCTCFFSCTCISSLGGG